MRYFSSPLLFLADIPIFNVYLFVLYGTAFPFDSGTNLRPVIDYLFTYPTKMNVLQCCKIKCLSQIDEYPASISENNISVHFILLCETFLQNDVPPLWDIHNYNLICKNRKKISERRHRHFYT